MYNQCKVQRSSFYVACAEIGLQIKFCGCVMVSNNEMLLAKLQYSRPTHLQCF